jgi:hypothetical protein
VSEPICFVDIETDGVRDDRRLWEASIIRVDADGVSEQTVIVTDSGVTGREEPEALEINRYHERFVRQLTYPEMRAPGYAAARVLYQLLDGAWFVAAQPQFDAHSLSRLLRWHGHEPPWKRRLRDIESEIEAHLGTFGIGGLQACAKALGVPVDAAVMHTSLGDARLVRACWERIFQPGQVDG